MNTLPRRKKRAKRKIFTILSWCIILGLVLVSLTNLIRSLQATHHTPSESIINSKIPRKLWFTYKDDLLNTKQPTQYYENVMKTINAYRKAWGDLDVEAHILSDDDCSKILIQINKELLEIFKAETVDAYKGDICRLGALYLYGGYYFDVDMQIVTPYIVPSDVSFSSLRRYDGLISSSFMASTPEHRMLQLGIDEMITFDRKKGIKKCNFLRDKSSFGPCLLNQASTRYRTDYRKKAPSNEKVTYLQEYESPSGLSPSGFEVSHPLNGERYFFSRVQA